MRALSAFGNGIVEVNGEWTAEAFGRLLAELETMEIRIDGENSATIVFLGNVLDGPGW